MNTRQDNSEPLPASDLFGDLRALEIGERILDGDLVWWQDQFFPATDTGNGVMSTNHFPHYRSPNAPHELPAPSSDSRIARDVRGGG